MAQQSNIEWTDSTWNPIRGCSPVSPGCKNCYAANTAKRFSGPGKPFEGLVRINAAGERTNDWNGNITFVEKHLLDPLKWRPVVQNDFTAYPGSQRARELAAGPTHRPRRIFVNSVSDLFHENVTDEMRDRIFAVMALCPHHRFQVLTKRPERMSEYFLTGPSAHVRWAFIGQQAQIIHHARTRMPVFEWSGFPLPNVLLGASIENEEWATKRWEPMYALHQAGWKTMVSWEPALGHVQWEGWHFLDWIIAGGESQHGARASNPAWYRSARDYAAVHHIPFLFKQWGEFLPDNQNPAMTQDPPPPATGAIRVGKKKAGHLLDGKEHLAFPEGF